VLVVVLVVTVALSFSVVTVTSLSVVVEPPLVSGAPPVPPGFVMAIAKPFP